METFIQQLNGSICRDPQPNSRQILWVLWRRGRKAQRNQRSQGHYKNMDHRINSLGFMGVRKDQEPVAVWPLHMCYGWAAWCSCGMLNSGSKGDYWLSCLLVEPFVEPSVMLYLTLMWWWYLVYCSSLSGEEERWREENWKETEVGI